MLDTGSAAAASMLGSKTTIACPWLEQGATCSLRLRRTRTQPPLPPAGAASLPDRPLPGPAHRPGRGRQLRRRIFDQSLGHPVRSGRNLHQVGKKGKSNHRWIRGGKLGITLNQLGLVVDWDCATAPIFDQSARSAVPAPAGQLRRRDDCPDRHRVSPGDRGDTAGVGQFG